MFPVEKYHYYVDEKNRKVIAVSTYGGKTVKGYAKCDPRDEFDINKGMELAAARCAEKITRKRMARAEAKIAEAQAELEKARKNYQKMAQYYRDAEAESFDASVRVDELLVQYT